MVAGLVVSGFAFPLSTASGLPDFLWFLLATVAFVTGLTAFRLEFERRYPVVLRLGISPLGLRLKLPVPSIRPWNIACRWTDRPVLGPDWIGIRVLGLVEKYRLTGVQAARLQKFSEHPESAASVLPLVHGDD